MRIRRVTFPGGRFLQELSKSLPHDLVCNIGILAEPYCKLVEPWRMLLEDPIEVILIMFLGLFRLSVCVAHILG